jgi:hypothetical protein
METVSELALLPLSSRISSENILLRSTNQHKVHTVIKGLVSLKHCWRVSTAHIDTGSHETHIVPASSKGQYAHALLMAWLICSQISYVIQ